LAQGFPFWDIPRSIKREEPFSPAAGQDLGRNLALPSLSKGKQRRDEAWEASVREVPDSLLGLAMWMAFVP
jgi:hypothetical protein